MFDIAIYVIIYFENTLPSVVSDILKCVYVVDNFRRKFIVHRNLTSSNVLMRGDGTCVLSDFKTSVRIDGKKALPMPQVEILCYNFAFFIVKLCTSV